MVFVGNDAKQLSKELKFNLETVTLASPTPESLYSLVIDTIKKIGIWMLAPNILEK